MIKGEKVDLWGLSTHHVTEDYIRWLNDEEITKYFGLTTLKAHTAEDMKEWIHEMNHDPNVRIFSVFTKDDKFIGTCRMDIMWEWDMAVISLMIGNRDYWGKGIGTDIIKTLVKFSWDKLNLHRLEAGVLEGNEASLKCFQKNGFQIEGTREERRYMEGKYVSETMVGLVRTN